MLSNAYFLAKFRFDTAENEPAKNLQKFAKKMLIFPILLRSAAAGCRAPRERGASQPEPDPDDHEVVARQGQRRSLRRARELDLIHCGEIWREEADFSYCQQQYEKSAITCFVTDCHKFYPN